MKEGGVLSRYDWEELKQKFILGNYKNLKEFAEDNGLNYNSGAFKKSTTGWKEQKAQQKQKKSKKVIEKVTEKVASKEARKVAKQIDLIADSTERILKIINKSLQDEEQFNKHMIKLRQGYGPGEFEEDIEVRQTEVLDARRLNDLMTTLDKAAQLKRLIENVLDEPTRQKLEIEREKLELEKVRNKDKGLGDDEDEATGVILLPAINDSLLPQEVEDNE